MRIPGYGSQGNLTPKWVRSALTGEIGLHLCGGPLASLSPDLRRGKPSERKERPSALAWTTHEGGSLAVRPPHPALSPAAGERDERSF
jgi:hypothetical protein